jgi:hypothetical protein
MAARAAAMPRRLTMAIRMAGACVGAPVVGAARGVLLLATAAS